MPWWLIYGLGVVSLLPLLAIAKLFFHVCRLAWDWAAWKRLEIRRRDEWHYNNPYWQEAFDAGVKWADDGKPQGQPFLGRLRM